MRPSVVAVLSGLVVVSAFAGSASGAMIETGLYQLHNHPDGTVNPPPYGLRLDELFDITPDHDDFTMDFDDPSSNVQMTYDGMTIHIFGTAFGGRDIGAVYAAEPTTGLYTFDFTYTVGVGLVPGDDDLYVAAPSGSNFGFIQPPVGPAISLTDTSVGGFTFRFGDEDDDLGHRGFPGLSGWGWLTHHHESQGHIVNSDWIFTAELVPTPGATMLGLVGLVGLRRRR